MAGTIDAAATGLGLPIAHPDGQRLYGGHSMRVGGAQALSRSGCDSWTIALLARWGSAAVFGYIRDAPLSASTSVARQAVQRWAPPGLVDTPGPPRSTPLTSYGPQRLAPPPYWVEPSDLRLKILEARAASLEADTWCRHRDEVPAARAWQDRADAAVQTAVLGGPVEAATQTEG